MLTNLLKWTAIAGLIGSLSWHPLSNYRTGLKFVVSAAALVVLIQAVGKRRYVWMALSLLVAWVFNPVLPVRVSIQYLPLVSLTTALLFLYSQQTEPALALAPLSERTSGSEPS